MKIYRLIGMLLIGLSLAACNATVSVDPTTSSGSGSGGTDGGSTPPPPDSTTPPPDNTTPPPPDSGTPPPADTTPPTVLGTKPIDNGTAPSSSTTITVTFDEAIDPASVTASTVSLSSSSGNLSVTESVSGDKLVITSATPFQNGISYTATVAGTVTDTAGNAMGTDYIWHFVAADDLCAGIYQSGYDPVYGMDTTPPPPMSKPAKGVPYADPAYGTCIIRATDHSVEPPAGFARNDYSRRQPFNSDDSMYLVYDDNGYFHIYDAHDLSYIRRLNLGGGSTEPQWSPTDPDILYVFPNHGGMTISKYNVLTDQRTVVADFTKLASIAGHPGMTSLTDIWPSAARVWTRSEGSPSRDYRYWGLMVETDSFQSLGLITYDMQTNTVTGVYDFATDGNGIGRPDHVSMSPSGKYVVPSWNGPGQDCSSRSALGTVNNPCGLMSFSRDFSSAVGLAVRGPHSDIAIDATGNDVIVISNYNTGYVEMYDLGTGAMTQLWNIYINGAATGMHISGKAYDHPGWVLISTIGAKNPNNVPLWYQDKLMAVELTANPRIINLAHTYDTVDQYFSEVQAAVNRDFTRAMFNSNWNSGDYLQVDDYMMMIPPGAIPPAM